MRVLNIAAVGLALASPVVAQVQTVAATNRSRPMMASVDTNSCTACDFASVGPPRGGRVTTVTGVPSQPRTFYMGVASGGLFKTTDAGTSWVPITDGKVPVASTGAVAVAESDPNIIYLGTGSDDIRSNVSTGAASTNRPTAVRRGHSPACTMPARSAQSTFTRRTRMSRGSRRSGTRSRPTPSAAYSRLLMVERPGRKCCSCPTASEPPISN